MSDEHEINPLVQRVDALLRSHHEQALKAELEIPVLTEAVEPEAAASAGAIAPATRELLEAIEAAVLERLWPELDRILERQLQELRAELAASFRQAVRQAIARAAREGGPEAS
ncbi:MAG: hypothetical protein M0015_14740 [Betaproteobacteria bacterium]|nr:hypothetical protein [Betaproteobacteria bacterium]